MTDFELVQRFQSWERELNQLGYKVSAINMGFYIHNNKGTIVADVSSVDGLRGFAQGIEYMNSLKDKE
jgi:hypothetical protein